VRAAILLLPLLTLAACGGPGPIPAPSLITLQPGGASPISISVFGGTELQFVNLDAADHQVFSSGCPELDSPTLAAGASFTATLGAGPKACGFSDGLHPSSAAFQGSVIVELGRVGHGGGD